MYTQVTHTDDARTPPPPPLPLSLSLSLSLSLTECVPLSLSHASTCVHILLQRNITITT